MNAKSKILVVDDSRSILEAIRNILEREYTVRTVSNGEEALEIFNDYVPDIVLLDVKMPGLDGYDVCRKIRSNKSLGFIKVVMISGEDGLENRLKGYEAGVDDYLPKPFDRDELIAKVKVFTKLKKTEDQLHELNSQLSDQIRTRTDQLIEAEKMAAIGKYSAGIVHNLNNPLQAVLGYAQLMEFEQPDNSSIKKLQEAAILMREMIATILIASSQENGHNVKAVDLNKVIGNQIELMKANQFFKHNVKIDIDLQPLPLYPGVYAHFSQSLGNILKNAVDAMCDSKDKILSVRTSSEADILVITIADTGNGIAKKNMKHIFDPFFTTKPLTANDDMPSGTGLGLASSKEMIESYGGNILVKSEAGTGSEFKVILPVK